MIISHDLGTTGDKATLVTTDGTLVGSVTVTYPTDFGPDGKAEQDATRWWHAFCEANRRLTETFGVDADAIEAVSFSGQMMGAVLLDAAGEPLRPAIIWADTRAQDQCTQLVHRIGMDEAYQITGHRLNPTYSLSKLMWIRDNEPDTFARARHFVTAKDYLLRKLTGEAVSDPSDASGTNAFDQANGKWSSELICGAELSLSLFPDLVASATNLGGLSIDAAREAHLGQRTQVIVGGGDGPMGALGAGILNRDSGIYTYLGSSSWVSYADSKPLHDPAMRSMTFNHVLEGQFVPTATMQTGGAALDWVTQCLSPGNDDRFTELFAAAERSSAAATGLYFLPHLIGERSPHWNPRARAAFLGLTITHDRGDLVRAVIEGVAFNLLTGLKAFTESGSTFTDIKAIGGAAKSPVIQQILADVWQLDIRASDIGDHATALGAAAIAAYGAGLIPESAIADFVGRPGGPTAPATLAMEDRDRWYRQFVDAYQRLEPWFDTL